VNLSVKLAEDGFKGSDASWREARLQKEKQTRRQQKRRTPPAKPKKDPSRLGRPTTNTRNSISRSNAAPSGGYFATQTDHQERPKSLSVGTFASEVGENRSQCAVNCKAAIEKVLRPSDCVQARPIKLSHPCS
jgi:hypothetical protein